MLREKIVNIEVISNSGNEKRFVLHYANGKKKVLHAIRIITKHEKGKKKITHLIK